MINEAQESCVNASPARTATTPGNYMSAPLGASANAHAKSPAPQGSQKYASQARAIDAIPLSAVALPYARQKAPTGVVVFVFTDVQGSSKVLNSIFIVFV